MKMHQLIGFCLYILSFSIFAESVSEACKNKQVALTMHNKYRAAHHVPNLVWDDTLARFAEKYASKCQFRHARYGENLAAGQSSMQAAIIAWYSEQKNYSYFRPRFSKNTGHFTQIVWKSTKKLGCGYAVCNGKNGVPGTFWICEYSPAGNINSSAYFRKNVFAH